MTFKLFSLFLFSGKKELEDAFYPITTIFCQSGVYYDKLTKKSYLSIQRSQVIQCVEVIHKKVEEDIGHNITLSREPEDVDCRWFLIAADKTVNLKAGKIVIGRSNKHRPPPGAVRSNVNHWQALL